LKNHPHVKDGENKAHTLLSEIDTKVQTLAKEDQTYVALPEALTISMETEPVSYLVALAALLSRPDMAHIRKAISHHGAVCCPPHLVHTEAEKGALANQTTWLEMKQVDGSDKMSFRLMWDVGNCLMGTWMHEKAKQHTSHLGTEYAGDIYEAALGICWMLNSWGEHPAGSRLHGLLAKTIREFSLPTCKEVLASILAPPAPPQAGGPGAGAGGKGSAVMDLTSEADDKKKDGKDKKDKKAKKDKSDKKVKSRRAKSPRTRKRRGRTPPPPALLPALRPAVPVAATRSPMPCPSPSPTLP
jgi:hypothetical protein